MLSAQEVWNESDRVEVLSRQKGVITDWKQERKHGNTVWSSREAGGHHITSCRGPTGKGGRLQTKEKRTKGEADLVARGWDDPLRPPRRCFHPSTLRTGPPASPRLLSSACSYSPPCRRGDRRDTPRPSLNVGPHRRRRSDLAVF